MPRSMHVVRGLSSLNTRKPKIKLTKKRILELKEEHRLHNKRYKHDKMLSHIMVMDFDTYIKWRFGKLKRKIESKGTYMPETNVTTKKDIPSRKIDIDKNACSKPDDDYKREISGQYVIGQAYNKSGLQVLTRKETLDPNTGKRR